MSQPDSSAPQTNSHVLFSGPTFHVSGVQIVGDPGEVSLYLTTTRHAFSQTGMNVRSVNEVSARLTMSHTALERMSEVLTAYVEKAKRERSDS